MLPGNHPPSPFAGGQLVKGDLLIRPGRARRMRHGARRDRPQRHLGVDARCEGDEGVVLGYRNAPGEAVVDGDGDCRDRSGDG
jgi:hypothetical protein